MMLGELRLPGALSVTTTEFTRRPDPDRRRVDKPTANDTSYAFGAGDNSAALVNDRGLIVYYSHSMHPRKERELTAVLDFMVAKQRAAARTAAQK